MKKRTYVVTLEKKVIDARENKLVLKKEFLMLIDGVGYFVFIDENISPKEINLLFLKTLEKEKIKARKTVEADSPESAINEIMRESGEYIHSLALAISGDHILEVPECSLLLKNKEKDVYYCSTDKVCFIECSREYHSCILVDEEKHGHKTFAGVVKFVEKTINLKGGNYKIMTTSFER